MASVYPAAWLLVAGVVLTIAMHLTPRPARAPGVLSDRRAIAIACAIPLLALIARLLAPESQVVNFAWIAK